MSSSNHHPEPGHIPAKKRPFISSLVNILKPFLIRYLFSFFIRFLLARPWLTGVTSVCTLLSMLILNFAPEPKQTTYQYQYTNKGFKRYQAFTEHPLSYADQPVLKMHESGKTVLAGAQDDTPHKPEKRKQTAKSESLQLVNFKRSVKNRPTKIQRKKSSPAHSMQVSNGPMILRTPGAEQPVPETTLLKPVSIGPAPAAWLTGKIESESKPDGQSKEQILLNSPFIIRSAKKTGNQ